MSRLTSMEPTGQNRRDPSAPGQLPRVGRAGRASYASVADIDLGGEFVPCPGPPALKVWRTRAHEVVQLECRVSRPRLPARLNSLGRLRAFYARELARAGRTLVWVSPGRADGCPAIRVISRTEVRTRGTFYFGSVVIPFADRSYQLSVTLPAGPATETRRRVVRGWHLDLRSLRTGWLATLLGFRRTVREAAIAEQEDFDEKFPAEALSRLRGLLRRIECAVELAESAKLAPALLPRRRWSLSWAALRRSFPPYPVKSLHSVPMLLRLF